MTMSPFYIEMEFSATADFSVIAATQTLAVRVLDANDASEGSPAKRGGGVVIHSQRGRKRIDVDFWPFSTVAQDPYPTGQDVGDFNTWRRMWRTNDYARISDCNCQDFAEFPDDNPLPMEVYFDGDLVAKKDEVNQWKLITVTLWGREPL